MSTLAKPIGAPVLLTTTSPSINDTWLFGLVCAFWFSQVFLIPFLPVGFWPLWPTFADLIIPFMIMAVWVSPRGFGSAGGLVRASAMVTCLCFVSLVLATLIHGSGGTGVLFGLAQLYRLMQALVAVLGTAKIRLTPYRVRVLSGLSITIFFIISFSIFATSFGLISTTAVAPMLPSGAIAGPWTSYKEGMLEGIGFISHNHGYTAIQLLLSLGLLLSLNKNIAPSAKAFVYLTAVSAGFVTRSRSGFICILIMLVAIEIKKSKVLVGWILASVLLIGAYLAGSSQFQYLTDRQLSSTSALQDDGLSGRTDVWKDYGTFFIDHPVTLFTGVGFGYAVTISPYNAHLLYLQIVAEMGIFGLFAFLWLQWKLLSSLRRKRALAMVWTVVALLLTGLSQETLYPVIIFTHFIAFYLSAIAAVVRVSSLESVTVREADAGWLIQSLRVRL